MVTLLPKLVAAVSRQHPALTDEQVAAVGRSFANEMHAELCQRSLRWRDSKELGALFRESESRACASIVFSLGETV